MIIHDIPLHELLSSCIDACRRGCEVIRNVKNKSLNASISASDEAAPAADNDSAGDVTGNLNVKYKIANDPRSALTEADEASQKVIVSILREAWAKEIEKGAVKIVGEEDEDSGSNDESGSNDDVITEGKGKSEAANGLSAIDGAKADEGDYSLFDKYKSPSPDVEPIQKHMFSDSVESKTTPTSGTPESAPDSGKLATETINNPIIIFIDPMDGTREFVENRVRNVQCLIGITYDGLPLGGAVGMPLVHGEKIEVAYGLIHYGDGKVTRGVGDDKKVDCILSGVKYFDAVNPMTFTGIKSDVGGITEGLDATNSAETGLSALDESETLVVLSGDSKKPILKAAMECLETRVLSGMDSERNNNNEPSNDNTNGGGEKSSTRRRKYPPYRKIVAGGCGNKMLYVGRRSQLQRREKVSQMNEVQSSLSSPSHHSIVGAISIAPAGSSSWDTASPTAVLLAIDPLARVTDLIGRPLIYDGVRLTNEAGVVVSSGDVAVRVHEDLTGKLSKDEHFLTLIGVKSSLAATSSSSIP